MRPAKIVDAEQALQKHAARDDQKVPHWIQMHEGVNQRGGKHNLAAPIYAKSVSRHAQFVYWQAGALLRLSPLSE